MLRIIADHPCGSCLSPCRKAAARTAGEAGLSVQQPGRRSRAPATIVEPVAASQWADGARVAGQLGDENLG